MTIGIICAIPEELGHLQGLLEGPGDTVIAGRTFASGTLDGHAVVLVGAGIGKVNTAMTATLLAQHFGVRLIIFSGVAGGLDPALHIGDVVIADRTLQHDAGWIADERIHTYQAGHVPFFNPTERLGYAVAGDLVRRVERALEGIGLEPLSDKAGGDGRAPVITFGTILSGDQFLNCELTRIRLFRELGGKAIEMEGGALGQVCEAFGIPHLDIRALSDLAGAESNHDFAAFVHEVAASSATILRRILGVV